MGNRHAQILIIQMVKKLNAQLIMIQWPFMWPLHNAGVPGGCPLGSEHGPCCSLVSGHPSLLFFACVLIPFHSGVLQDSGAPLGR